MQYCAQKCDHCGMILKTIDGKCHAIRHGVSIGLCKLTYELNEVDDQNFHLACVELTSE